MKKFGLGKKDSGEDDAKKRPLFGSRSKTKPPAPATKNPYAQPAVAADPYTQAKANLDAGAAPPSQSNGGPRQSLGVGTGLPSGPSMKKAHSYTTSSNGVPLGYGDQKTTAPGMGAGYGNDRYGDQGGYGQEKFGASPYGGGPPVGGNSRYGGGGYGGLGPPEDNDTASMDASRNELLGGARERLQNQGPSVYGDPPPYGADGDSNINQQPGHGAYGDRQLTAEEEEKEDIDATKQEIKFMKQQDVAATRNALRAAAVAEETGQNTLARLGAQGERMHNTDRNLDLSANHQRIAEEKAKELKVANRSMFRMHVDNPFTKGGRERRDQEILGKHRQERDQREASRQAAYQSEQRMGEKFKGLSAAGSSGPKSKSTLAERAKYQFEADSEDDEIEEELENNIDQLSAATGRLGMLAKAQGDEVEQQNRLLEHLATKTDKVDDYIAVNRKRLDRSVN